MCAEDRTLGVVYIEMVIKIRKVASPLKGTYGTKRKKSP